MEPTYPYPIYYVIARSNSTPQMVMTYHVIKVVETTIDQINAVYQHEALPLIARGIDIYTLIFDRPANLDFLTKLAEAEKASVQ